jgi:hypothetical protein
MELLDYVIAVVVIVLVGWHVYTASQFRSSILKNDPGVWVELGSPNPLAFWWWDLKRFKVNYSKLIEKDRAIEVALINYERSWTIGLPTVLCANLIYDFVK